MNLKTEFLKKTIELSDFFSSKCPQEAEIKKMAKLGNKQVCWLAEPLASFVLDELEKLHFI